MTDFMTTIGNISEIFDGPHATPHKTEAGPIFLCISSLENGRLDLSKSAHISEFDFAKWTKRVTPQQGDLLFSYETRLGEAALMPDGVKACLGRRMGLLRPRRHKVIPEYLLYAYLSPAFQQTIVANTITGATVDRISLNRMANFGIRIPIIKEQKNVARLLQALDAKIDCNNRINAELETMAKTLYDYWFVQFEFPDVNGKPYKSSGGKMAYNTTLKREIPLGWKEGSLWKIAEYFNGLAMQKYRPIGTDYLPVIKIKEMGEGISDSTEKARPDIPRKAIIDDGDILFSWSATLDVKIWTQGKGALNQHIFKVTSSNFPKTFYYFELLAYLAHFKMMAEKRKTTMGHITQDHLKQSRICIPPTELLSKAHKIIEPIFKKHLLHEKENQQLAQLRDWLLPMLMNGQVTQA